MELGAAVGSFDLSYEVRHQFLVFRLNCFFDKCCVHHILQAAAGSSRQLQVPNCIQPTFEVKSQDTLCRTVTKCELADRTNLSGCARRPEYMCSICEPACLRSRMCKLRSGQHNLGCKLQVLDLLPSQQQVVPENGHEQDSLHRPKPKSCATEPSRVARG